MICWECSQDRAGSLLESRFGLDRRSSECEPSHPGRPSLYLRVLWIWGGGSPGPGADPGPFSSEGAAVRVSQPDPPAAGGGVRGLVRELQSLQQPCVRSHFTGEETEAQRDHGARPGHTPHAVEAGRPRACLPHASFLQGGGCCVPTPPPNASEAGCSPSTLAWKPRPGPPGPRGRSHC